MEEKRWSLDTSMNREEVALRFEANSRDDYADLNQREEA